MTRKEFLNISWNRYLKPIITAILLIISTSILLEAITTNGGERYFVITIIVISAFATLLMLLNLASNLLSEWLITKTPNSIQYALTNTKTVIRKLSLIACIWLIYELYEQQNYIGIAISLWFLFQEIRQLRSSSEQKSI